MKSKVKRTIYKIIFTIISPQDYFFHLPDYETDGDISLNNPITQIVYSIYENDLDKVEQNLDEAVKGKNTKEYRQYLTEFKEARRRNDIAGIVREIYWQLMEERLSGIEFNKKLYAVTTLNKKSNYKFLPISKTMWGFCVKE